jgi:hypothetical protein
LTRPTTPASSAAASTTAAPSTAGPTSDPQAPAAPSDPAPAAAADPPPRRALVEVRFDSQPGGSVFAEGRPTELCRTPCAFDIDLADGGALDHRVFLVKRSGYVDSPVTVDLTGTQREFRVALQRDPRGDARDATERRPARRTARPARKDTKPSVAPEAEPKPTEAETRPAVPEAPPATPGKPTAIDPADTLDPFRKK